MKSKVNIQDKILNYIMVVFIIIIILFPWEIRIMRGHWNMKESEIRFWNSGWYVVTDAGEIPCELPYTARIKRGEKVIIRRDITEDDWNKWLVLSILNEFFEVYIDDELIYEQETCYSPKYGIAPIGGRHYICIPEGTKQLRMEAFSPYSNSEIRYSHVGVADSEGTLLRAYQAAYQYHLLIDMALIMAGLGCSMWGINMYVRGERKNLLIRLGMLMITVGVWLRTGTTNIDMYFLSVSVQRQLAYVTFLLIPFCMCGMMKCYFKDKYRKYRIWQYLCLALFIIYYTLYFTGVFELLEMIPAIHLVLIVLMASFFGDSLIVLQRERKTKRYIRMTAMMLVLLASIAEMIVFYANRNRLTDGYWMRIGILLCITLLTIEEISSRRRNRMEELQNQAVEKELRLQVTLSQLQPHFLFNALGAIRIMIHMNADAAYDMLYDFSGFLRSCIGNLQEQKSIPFGKEMNQIRSYLNIERIRFNERIQVVYELETEEFSIPPLTVEPLVVNAVHHGLRKGKDRGTVTIRTRQEEQRIIIEVSDDGIGFDIDAWNRDHPFKEQYESEKTSYMGLENVRSRLYHQARGLMMMESRPMVGTTITIILPASQESAAQTL